MITSTQHLKMLNEQSTLFRTHADYQWLCYVIQQAPFKLNFLINNESYYNEEC